MKIVNVYKPEVRKVQKGKSSYREIVSLKGKLMRENVAVSDNTLQAQEINGEDRIINIMQYLDEVKPSKEDVTEAAKPKGRPKASTKETESK